MMRKGTSAGNLLSVFPLPKDYYFSVLYTAQFQLDVFCVCLWGFFKNRQVVLMNMNACSLLWCAEGSYGRYGGSQQTASLRLCLVFSCCAVDLGSTSCKTIWGKIPNNVVQILF